jgi:hypothetical protein
MATKRAQLIQALKDLKDSEPANTDEAYEGLADILLAHFPALWSGAGLPTDILIAPTLTDAAEKDLYFDTLNNKYYLYDGSNWHLMTSA